MKAKLATITTILIILAATASPSFSQTGISPRPTPAKPSFKEPRMQPDVFTTNIPNPSRSPLPIPDPGPGWGATSSYLVGRVAVSIIFVESDGTIDTSTENWTPAMLNATEAEIKAGLAWWVAREPDAGLEMVYPDRIVANTSYEPITRASTEEWRWIGEIMTDLGYDQNYVTAVRNYVNDVRKERDADWALAIFVVNDANDADDAFTDGYYAYAFYGGPYLAVTYENGEWGAGNQDAITAHEFGHVFWALDQYDYEDNSQDCDDRSGYLYEENQNLDIPAANCDSDVASIMRQSVSTAFAAGSLDGYARSQVGWDDTDADGIPDVIDTTPTITVTGAPGSPSVYPTLIFTGTVVDVPLE